MATLIEIEKVKIQCSCKRLKPLACLYYCKYCKPFSLKCKECVLHEVIYNLIIKFFSFDLLKPIILHI